MEEEREERAGEKRAEKKGGKKREGGSTGIYPVSIPHGPDLVASTHSIGNKDPKWGQYHYWGKNVFVFCFF